MASIRDRLRGGTVKHAINAATGVGARASSQMVTMVVTLYAARLLAPEAFGVFAISVAWITLVRTTFYSGAYEYLLKAPDARKVSTESLAVNLVTGVVMTLPLLVIAPLSEVLFKSSSVGVLLLTLAPSNLIAAFGAWQESLVLRAGKMRSYYLVTTVAEVVSGVVAVVLLAMGYGLGALVAQVYARNAIGLLGFLLLRSTVLSERFSWTTMKEVMRWALSCYMGVFVGFGTTYAADLALGIFLSPAASGLYRASNRIVSAVSDVIAQPARMLAMTAFSSLASSGRSADRQWAAMTTAAAVVGWSALGGLAVVGPMLVPAILGDKWSGAAALIPVLCAARATTLLDTLSGTLLVIYDRQRQAFRLQVFGAVVMIACLVCFAPFGVVAATWGVLIASVITSTVQMLFGWKHFPDAAAEFRRQMFVMALPVVATVGGALAAMKLSQGHVGPTVGAALIVVAGAGAWAFCLIGLRQGLMAVVRALKGEAGAPAVA